jgi:hypothetical protein
MRREELFWCCEGSVSGKKHCENCRHWIFEG